LAITKLQQRKIEFYLEFDLLLRVKTNWNFIVYLEHN